MRKGIKTTDKTIRSVNFENVVLDKLEALVFKEKTDFSKLINFICRKYCMDELVYFVEMKKHHIIETTRYDTIIQELRRDRQ